VENEQVLNGTAQQAADGLRVYEEWRGKRTARIAEGSVPRIRTKVAQSVSRAVEAEGIVVETVTLPAAPGRPAGRKFGLVVHEILQRAESAEEIAGLAAVWGRRHGASEQEIAAAGEAARTALAAVVAPEGAKRYREMPVMVRLEDGTIVDGRVDCAWSDGMQWVVIDYKTDRREKRNVAQVQLYGLALQRATGLPARGVVLEI
jgi:ATP-dependent exoDNAse (exonuclease V) beta subunit